MHRLQLRRADSKHLDTYRGVAWGHRQAPGQRQDSRVSTGSNAPPVSWKPRCQDPEVKSEVSSSASLNQLDLAAFDGR
jgi:hypothetical protein